MTNVSDVPAPLMFVDPQESDSVFRVVLWASPGQGKSVGAASAPGPILAISADRPGAYRFARRKHPGKEIREIRYVNSGTLTEVYKYIRERENGIKTLVLDPFGNIYDKLADEFPAANGETNWQGLNKKIKGFLFSLRDLDVNVVIVAHEKISDGKNGDGKLYPSLGGPALINAIVAESDIVAHVERVPGAGDDEPATYIGRVQPAGNLVCKDSTDALGQARELDLTEWFATATAHLAPDESDLPFAETPDDDGDYLIDQVPDLPTPADDAEDLEKAA